ncbi:cell division protein FtsQ [Aquibacillus kalidii]|uniref:cell division protein FtsQ n=1 Tax=Aquibacillus kalidii TaxID=2762597 RepID=UPI001644E795|nr:cell division protein FtsQ [Aquibacillus kalidii]
MQSNIGPTNQQGQSQKLMVFVLSMALFGLGDLVTELVPDIGIGSIEFGVPYFGFIGLILVMLFNPLYAALGAAVGEVVFGDLLMGDFGGLGEIEGVLTLFIGLYIAGLLVKNLNSKFSIAIAGMVGIAVEQVLGGLADCIKVWVGVEDLEAIQGLPESIVILELVECSMEWVIAGVIVGIIPSIILIPKLHGKIEPLLGVKPRQGAYSQVAAGYLLVVSIAVFVGATLFGVIGEAIEIGAWEPDFIDQFGGWFVWVGMAIAAVVLIITLLLRPKSKQDFEHPKAG